MWLSCLLPATVCSLILRQERANLTSLAGPLITSSKAEEMATSLLPSLFFLLCCVYACVIKNLNIVSFTYCSSTCGSLKLSRRQLSTLLFRSEDLLLHRAAEKGGFVRQPKWIRQLKGEAPLARHLPNRPIGSRGRPKDPWINSNTRD